MDQLTSYKWNEITPIKLRLYVMKTAHKNNCEGP